jgi:hypothetical protein
MPSIAELIEHREMVEETLSSAGFIVQEGSMQVLDCLALASEGRLSSCFGNNAGSAYTALFLPPAPGQEAAKAPEGSGLPDEEPGVAAADGSVLPANPYFSPVGWSWKLRGDEAVLVLGYTPPACIYHSLVSYVLLSEDDSPAKEEGAEGDIFYHSTFASLGRSANMRTLKHEGTRPDLASFAYLLTGDVRSAEVAAVALSKLGITDAGLNVHLLPAQVLSMGLGTGKDTFAVLGRASGPEDPGLFDQWLSAVADETVVLRLTPKKAFHLPAPAGSLAPRGTGMHEAGRIQGVREGLAAIRDALVRQYGKDYEMEELPSRIAVTEGLTAYLDGRNAEGDNPDAAYLMTGDFTFESDEDFCVVYGVNHTRSGKATYSNVVLYAKPWLAGIASIYDRSFEGSAEGYVPAEVADPDDFYVFKLARPGWALADGHTVEVPASTGNPRGRCYGADAGQPLFCAFRAYMEPETGTGPAYSELIWDRLMVFHKKGDAD